MIEIKTLLIRYLVTKCCLLVAFFVDRGSDVYTVDIKMFVLWRKSPRSYN